MGESGRFLIDGLDAYDTYGIIFREGAYNELLKLPTKKQDVIIDDWPDQNGKDRIFSDPKFDSITYNIPIAHVGANEADFFAKYNLFTKFTQTKVGYFNLDVALTGKRFKMLYQDMPAFNKRTLIEDSDGTILCESTLSLINDFPVDVFQDGDVFFGVSDGIPTSEEDVLELNKEEETNTVTIDTGTSERFFIVAIRTTVTISAITDLDAPMFSDVKSGYILRSTIEIEGLPYNIYTLELAVPYTTSHRHKIDLI